MRTKSKILILVVCMFFSTVFVSYAEEMNGAIITGDNNTVVFSDVDENYDWAREAIESFARQGIVSGVGNGEFAPGEMVTREQFATMLVLTFNAPLVQPEEPTFSDVPVDRWSAPYIEASKEFLTGYANPFGGKPTFRPSEPATREDMAVALVRIMGLSADDLQNGQYVFQKFTDAQSISPGLVELVGVAAERNLIAGYPDGTFGPGQPITRAESVVLLNRAMKQAVSTIEAELEISAEIVQGIQPGEFTLSITAEEGTEVKVDGQEVVMNRMGDGYVKGMVLYTFESEGTKTFVIEAEKGAKKRALEKIVEYKLEGPEIVLTQMPTSTNLSIATIKGTVTDKYDENPLLTINGQSVVVSWNGNFEQTVELEEGANIITIVATNRMGKSTTLERTITLGADIPTLNITHIPTTTDQDTAVIKGNVTDMNDSEPSVSINGEPVTVFWNGDFEYITELDEGENVFQIVATNDLGKSTTIERSIIFEVEAPDLYITHIPTTTDQDTAVIKGNVKDKNDEKPSVMINGEAIVVSWNGNFEHTVDLVEGENTFTIVATNNRGKSTSLERTIMFGADAPILNITEIPTTTEKDTLTIKGNVSDKNDSEPSVTINGEAVEVYWNGNFDYTADLVEGENSFTIIATNNQGKSTTVEKTIHFNAGAPELTITQIPTVTEQETVRIKGTVTDKNDGTPVVTINGESVRVSWNHNFEHTVDLEEGENTITIVATNRLGKSTTVERSITFNVSAPEIIFTNIPEITNQSHLSLQGKIKDSDDHVKLYINDQEVRLDYNHNFSKNVTLSEGDNTFVFRAVNSYGKSTSVVKTVRFEEIVPPTLHVDNVPPESNEATINVTGSVTDHLDPNVKVYVNDQQVASTTGSWSATVNLIEGSNDIIIVAENKFGKSVTEIRNVTYFSPDHTGEQTPTTEEPTENGSEETQETTE